MEVKVRFCSFYAMLAQPDPLAVYSTCTGRLVLQTPKLKFCCIIANTQVVLWCAYICMFINLP